MKKYEEMMLNQLSETYQKWDERGSVEEKEIYSFFHRIKGTAGTIGLNELSEKSNLILNRLSESSDRLWTEKEWKQLYSEVYSNKEVKREDLKQRAEKESSVPANERNDKNFILIIDKDIQFIDDVKEYLENNRFQVLAALSGKKGLEMFYDFKPGLIILDSELPDINGISILYQLVDSARHSFTPIIMTGSSPDSSFRAKAYEIGAIDFIGKPVDREIFIPFIRNRLKLRDLFIHSAIIDELTGAYNRKFFGMELERQLNMIEEDLSGGFSVVMADLDHFKLVNDNYGHQTGDFVLRRLKETFYEVCDKDDTLARCGGEEFIAIMPHHGAEESLVKTERWRELFKNELFSSSKGSFSVNFSAGIKELTSSSESKELIVEKADKALYRAKETGRGRTVIYNKALENVKIKEKLNIIVIDDDEIVREMLLHHFNKKPEINQFHIGISGFANGLEFLNSDWYREDEYFLILLDGMMPKLDGIEVLKAIKNDYPRGNIIITMLSARKGEEMIARALRLGADDYMVKPFNINEVSVRIEHIVERVFS